MPVFELEAPDGKVFEVEGADAAGAVAALKKMQGGQPSVGADVVKSAGVGVAKGGIGLLGLPGDVAELGARGIDRATQFVGGILGADVKPREDRAPTYGSADIQKGVEGVTGEFYKPKTTYGKYAETVGEFAPGLIGGGGAGAIARRGVTQVLAPGLASEGAGQLAKKYAPEAEPYARVVGALAGGVAPSIAGRAITPLPNYGAVGAERTAAANALRGEGVELTAGQATGRKGLQYLEAERGAGPQLMDNQREQFTAAALRRVGENGTRATPEVIDGAFTRIGSQFDDLAARNTLVADRQLVNDATGSVRDYYNLVSPPNRTPAVTNFLEEMVTAVQRNGGSVPGDVYQSLRSRIERAARGMGNNPEARTALRELRESIDDAMERSIQSAGNAADLGAWREARNQYRNMLVVEKAATSAGENAALGSVSPAALRQAAVGQNRRAYARGNGDFAELARSGVATMSPLPNSGTPGRLAAQNIGTGTASIVGAALGGAAGAGAGPVGMSLGGAAGALAGAAVPRLVGRAVTSRPGRAYLGNQAMTPALENLNPRQAAIVDALMSARQEQIRYTSDGLPYIQSGPRR